jgi:hypothetical protein
MSTFFKYLKIELIKTKTVLFWLVLSSLVLFFYFLSGIAGIPSNSTWRSSVYNDSCISIEEFEKLPQEERDAETNQNHPNYLGGYYTHNCELIKENKIILSNLYTFQGVYSYIFLPIFIFFLVSYFSDFDKTKNYIYLQTTNFNFAMQKLAKILIITTSVLIFNLTILLLSSLAAWLSFDEITENYKKNLGSLDIPWTDIFQLGYLQSIGIILFIPVLFLIAETFKKLKLNLLTPIFLLIYPFIHIFVTMADPTDTSSKDVLWAFGFWIGNFVLYNTDRLDKLMIPTQFSANTSLFLLILLALVYFIYIFNQPKISKYVLRKFKNNPRIWNFLTKS